MKTQRRHSGALELINDILLARARLTQARSDLAVAQARAQTIKRDIKKNKSVGPFVQRQVRHAENEFIKASAILAKMEKEYLAVIQQPARKPLHPRSANPQAMGGKHSPAQAKPSAAVRAIKEKKPTVFRGLPAVKASLIKKQHSINPIRPH
ncbi:MAG TPA: hypothetical protein VMH87_02220 [Pseudomonadales bacterium]|nr:hypothetical protein [Pseudomonadales bacterium]